MKGVDEVEERVDSACLPIKHGVLVCSEKNYSDREYERGYFLFDRLVAITALSLKTKTNLKLKESLK